MVISIRNKNNDDFKLRERNFVRAISYVIIVIVPTVKYIKLQSVLYQTVLLHFNTIFLNK